MASSIIPFPHAGTNDNHNPVPPSPTGTPVLRLLTRGKADDDRAFAGDLDTGTL